MQPAPWTQQAQAARLSRSSSKRYSYNVGDDCINNIDNDDRQPSSQSPGAATSSTLASPTATANIPQVVARLIAIATTIELNTFAVLLPSHPTRIHYGTYTVTN